MFALVLNNRVAEIATDVFPVSPKMIWVDITGVDPAPEQGWEYDGTVFTAPSTRVFSRDEKRQMEYPSMGDQLDALLKQFEADKISGKVLESALNTVIADWRAIKVKYP